MAMATRDDSFEEVTLTDIVRVMQKRRVILGVVFALCLLAGGALTAFTTRQYAAQASVIPLEQADLFQSWLGSRQAAAFVVQNVGIRLNPTLFPSDWDATAQSWKGTARTTDDIAGALVDHVKVTPSKGFDPKTEILTVTITLPDALLARDVAAAYVGSLDGLRPQLENVTRATLFAQYYDGTNAQAAQARADQAASHKQYWVVFDQPAIPDAPVKPRPVLYMSIAVVAGIVLAMGTAFFLEWLGRYRADFQRVEPPR